MRRGGRVHYEFAGFDQRRLVVQHEHADSFVPVDEYPRFDDESDRNAFIFLLGLVFFGVVRVLGSWSRSK